ncbi:AAA family ATPase [Sphaerisporangium sp. NPDC088356]|uniref:AAA family ATPase n=1 Tax=Sphaerisporangium sp. NPDC088356 TaxID=3154871 RepID=UPI00343BA81F
MRLHRLRLTAFGSFPGDEEIDFDALGEAGLFLVHGPTGAGKTTVLDAVCYALYGQVPGQRNSARRLRCDHAPADRGPKVVLEVTVRGRRLRLTRSPVWHRPKLRGQGLIEEKAKVLLEELLPSGEWMFLSSRADEAGELVGGLLGMNADQFCQVAMLPQGDFARFLRADGDDRRKLLEKLFSVKIFSDVEHWLADHRTRTGQEQQELRQRVDSVIDHMRGAAGPALLASLTAPAIDAHAGLEAPGTLEACDGPDGRGDLGAYDSSDAPGRVKAHDGLDAHGGHGAHDGLDAHGGRGAHDGLDGPGPEGRAWVGVRAELDPRAEPLEWARALLAVAHESLAGQAEARAASEAMLRSARVELEGARELVQRQRGHAEALARRDELDRTADERSDLETILAEALRADRVLPLVQEAEQRAEAAAKAEQLAADAMARALPLLPQPPGCPGEPARVVSPGARAVDGLGPERLAELERGRRDEIARLEELRPEEVRLARVREELARAGKRLVALAEQEAETAERLAVLPELRRETGEALTQARLAASGLPPARAAVESAARELDAVRRRDALAAELAVTQRDLLQTLIELPAPLTAGLPGMDLLDPHGLPAGGVPAAGVREAARQVGERLGAIERAHRDELAGLELRRADEVRFAEIHEKLTVLDERLAGLADREAALADAQAELPARLEEIDGRLAAVRAEAARIPAAEAACQAADALLEQAGRRDALAAELEAAEGERRLATDEAQELRDRLQSIRQSRIDGMAAELARGLVPGEACAVCGSADHPAPASPAEATPTVDDEQAAQTLSDAAQEARQAAEGRVAVLSSQLGEATARAEGHSLEAALAARGEAEAELARLGALAEREPGLAAEAERVQSELDTARTRARELDLLMAEHRVQQSGLREELGRLTAVLDAARDGDESVAARRDRVDGQAQLLVTAIQAATRVGEAAATYEEARAAIRRGTLWATRHHTPKDDATPATGEPAERAEGPGAGFEGEPEAGDAERALAGAEAALAGLREVAGGESALAEAVRRIEAELAELTEHATRIGLEIAAERAQEKGLAADTERLAARLDAARGEDATLAARLERLTDEAELLKDAAEAGRLARSAGTEHETALTRAESAATDAGFPGVADARAAARSAAARDSMAERLRELDAELAAVTKLLADPELVAAAAMPVPDVAALAEAFETAEQRHGTHASARDQAGARHDQLLGLAETLERTFAEWRPAEERHRLAKRLAELAVGTSADNTLDMRLSSYVLGERLRQVVDAANERLDHMSGGRYLLLYDVRKSAADRKRSGGGLGLRVLDGWTGADRDPATLSGGEAFMTSLALALALADVVTAEAGGVELGTLFIDEGFGTLDEESLDSVLDILDELRDGGRAVGIVSHVGELRTRVPAQLKVVKNRFGSSLSVAVPG